MTNRPLEIFLFVRNFKEELTKQLWRLVFYTDPSLDLVYLINITQNVLLSTNMQLSTFALLCRQWC